MIITSPELKSLIAERAANQQPLVLLDVREPEEFEESRIEGAHLIPLGELGLRAESELKRSDEIIVYCAHGVRSLYGLRMLSQMGFQNLKSLDGGIVAYESGSA